MKVRLAYGKEGLRIDLPDDLHVDVIEPKYAEGLPRPAHAIRHALHRPIVSEPLAAHLKPTDTVGIVVNDITRATPYQVILPALLAEIAHVADERITFFVATGTHRPDTPDEVIALLGADVVARYRIVQNDANDRDSHALAGTTDSGNAIWIHRDYLACDLRILTGFIEPHFFAGFSGGGKACMPGMALLDTILRNHCPANIDHPQATWAVTRGNPIWEEVRAAAQMGGPSFLLNVALNRDKAITAVFAGDVEQAHARGCAFVKETAMAPVAAPYDIVVTSNSGYPLDLNLYQAVKGMSAAAQIVKPGGSIILAAECWDGVPDHGRYKELLFRAESPQALLERIRAGGPVVQDVWQAQIHALICTKADVHLFSHHLSDIDIEKAMLTPCRDIGRTIDALRRRHGPDARVAVLPEGPQTIPFVGQ
ncbi:MAG: nickel-dependent lactate racemase [Sedimentisphaerales bacterium]|nr:nickel-dependent lactate racemase [Sedimentisphaerales bacterium]